MSLQAAFRSQAPHYKDGIAQHANEEEQACAHTSIAMSQWVFHSDVESHWSGHARHDVGQEGCHLISGVILLRCKDCQVILPGIISKAISKCSL